MRSILIGVSALIEIARAESWRAAVATPHSPTSRRVAAKVGQRAAHEKARRYAGLVGTPVERDQPRRRASQRPPRPSNASDAGSGTTCPKRMLSIPMLSLEMPRLPESN